MKKKSLPLIIAVCCLVPVSVFAFQHPLITDLAETVAPLRFEAETAVEYSSNDEAGTKVKILKMEETVTAGIIPRLDAYVKLPFVHVKRDNGAENLTNSGLSDITFGTKWNFMHVDKISLAVKPFVLLPVGDEKKELGYGKAGYGADLIASLELNKHLAFDANVGFTSQGVKDSDTVNTFRGSVAGRYEATKELKAVAEIALYKTDVTDSEMQAVLTAGAVYEATKNLDVDLGVRLGLTKEAEDFVVLAAATFKF
jgi:hypothetical protein